MNPLFNLIAGPIFDSMNKLIDHFFPDANQAAAAKLEMLKMQQAGEQAYLQSDTNLALAQIDTNKAEASSGNAFASSWRPSIGYICALALFYNFIGYPIAMWYVAVNKLGVTVPPLIDNQLMTLVLGMLGLGTMRSFEKFKGVAK